MSLLTTYRALKNLMATKLTNKGVSNASGQQGLTTLINKIDNIQTTIPTTLTGDSTGTYPPDVDIDLEFLLKSSVTNSDGASIDTPIRNADIGIYIDDQLEETITTDNNGNALYTLNIDTIDTYTLIAVFDESRPFASALLTGIITIFSSVIEFFKNVSFTHSGGGSNMNVSYINNESITMDVQSFEEDEVTISKGSQVDYLISVNSDSDFTVENTVINDNQGYTSYTYEAQGQGDVYIKAQSHDDATVHTSTYLINDWIKKDFTGVGNWVAFDGRVNTFSSNTDTVFTQGNGSKGGVHSQNTVFYLPDDNYIVSFKIANGTIGTGVRIGLHSASYNDHHEKAVMGIENDSSGGFKFDYSTSEVTTVTKIITGVTTLNTDDLIEFKIVNDTVTFYINGTSYGSITLDWLHTPMWLYGQSWSTNNGNFSITDFRVKRIV